MSHKFIISVGRYVAYIRYDNDAIRITIISLSMSKLYFVMMMNKTAGLIQHNVNIFVQLECIITKQHSFFRQSTIDFSSFQNVKWLKNHKITCFSYAKINFITTVCLEFQFLSKQILHFYRGIAMYNSYLFNSSAVITATIFNLYWMVLVILRMFYLKKNLQSK